jgi:hypothetical protein
MQNFKIICETVYGTPGKSVYRLVKIAIDQQFTLSRSRGSDTGGYEEYYHLE